MQDEDLTRYFIVTTGRSGSSLLAAILGDSGADFGLSVPKDWDKNSGTLEHPAIDEVSRLFRRARYVSAGKRYFLFYKYLIDMRRSLGKKKLKRALRTIRYSKGENFDLWIWHVIKLGYRPQIIVTYRNFVDTAIGYYIIHGLDTQDFAARYTRAYRNALLMLNVFGGCAVDYAELIDPAETAWAEALARVTGLDRERLIESRAQRVEQRSGADVTGNTMANLTIPEVDGVYKDLQQLRGVYIPPSRQIMRKWGVPGSH